MSATISKLIMFIFLESSAKCSKSGAKPCEARCGQIAKVDVVLFFGALFVPLRCFGFWGFGFWVLGFGFWGFGISGLLGFVLLEFWSVAGLSGFIAPACSMEVLEPRRTGAIAFCIFQISESSSSILDRARPVPDDSTRSDVTGGRNTRSNADAPVTPRSFRHRVSPAMRLSLP
eukprot:scaffold1785_cov247-Pinguiococcus_pyrenoidosus.AAC.26